MALFTPEEKAQIRTHTGYPQVQPAASIQYGLPKPVQTAFMLELAMENVLPEGVERVRNLLPVLNDLEQKLIDAQCYLVVDSVEEIHMAGAGGDGRNRLVTERLEGEYIRWANRLVDVFGVPLYPFSRRFQSSSSRGVSNINTSG